MITKQEMRNLDGNRGGRDKPAYPVMDSNGNVYQEGEINTDLFITLFMFPELFYYVQRTVKFGKRRNGQNDKKIFIKNRRGKIKRYHYEVISNIKEWAKSRGLKRQIITDSLGRQCVAYVEHPGFYKKPDDKGRWLYDEVAV